MAKDSSRPGVDVAGPRPILVSVYFSFFGDGGEGGTVQISVC